MSRSSDHSTKKVCFSNYKIIPFQKQLLKSVTECDMPCNFPFAWLAFRLVFEWRKEDIVLAQGTQGNYQECLCPPCHFKPKGLIKQGTHSPVKYILYTGLCTVTNTHIPLDCFYNCLNNSNSSDSSVLTPKQRSYSAVSTLECQCLDYLVSPPERTVVLLKCKVNDEPKRNWMLVVSV